MKKNNENNEWIDLPIFDTEFYPKNIVDIAKKVGKPVSEIAENEGVQPGVFLWGWLRREDIIDSFRIIEYPYDRSMSLLLLLSGEQLLINMRHRKLMARIHKFLMSEPQYKFETEDEPVQQEKEEEGEDD